MTTATVSTAHSATRRIDRLALRIGTALVLWAGRSAERSGPTPQQHAHLIALQRLQLERETSAQRAMLGR